MKNIKKSIALCLTFAGVLFAGAAAKADSISFTIAPGAQVVEVGDQVGFTATITNMDPTDTVYLNGDSWTSGPLVVDDSPFFNNFPWYLTPGQSVTAELFTVSVPGTTPYGIYAGSFILLGGDSMSSMDDLASANFNVSAVPEPSSVALLMIGLAGLAALYYRQKNAFSL